MCYFWIMNYVIMPNDPWAKLIFYDIIGRKTKAGEHFLLYRDWLRQVVKITKFAIFAEAATGGVLWKKVFLKILQNSGLRPATLLKKRLQDRRFPVNFANFLRTPFFIEHLWWLLLYLWELTFREGLMQNSREVTKIEQVRTRLEKGGGPNFGDFVIT